jgi:hypothetical protein
MRTSRRFEALSGKALKYVSAARKRWKGGRDVFFIYPIIWTSLAKSDRLSFESEELNNPTH